MIFNFLAVSSDAWVVGAIAAIAAIIMRILDSREKSAENKEKSRAKQEDWHRQDEVANRLIDSNHEIAKAAKEADLHVVEGNAATNKQLKVIHTLVNSQMTAAIQDSLDSTTRELAMMNEVIGLRRAAGQEPSKEAEAALIATQSKINELNASLTDRLKQQQVADRQAKEPSRES